MPRISDTYGNRALSHRDQRRLYLFHIVRMCLRTRDATPDPQA